MAVTRNKRSRTAIDENATVDESAATSFDDDLDDPAESNTLTVHNVLASASLVGEPRLDLDRCSQVLGNSYYNPSEFPALRIDIRDRRRLSLFSISLFESGRIQSTGGCYPIEAKRAMLKISRRINKSCGYKTKLRLFEIQNILAVFDTGITVALSHFVQAFQGIVDYEPERFPAARVRIPIPKASEMPPQDATPATDADGTSDKVNAKIRRLMLGEDAACVSHSSTVGGYAVGSNSLRKPTGGKADGEKAPRAEAVHANVFSTGKVTFTGAKSIESLSYALDQIRPYLMSGRPFHLGGSSLDVVNLDKQFSGPGSSASRMLSHYTPISPPLRQPLNQHTQFCQANERIID